MNRVEQYSGSQEIKKSHPDRKLAEILAVPPELELCMATSKCTSKVAMYSYLAFHSSQLTKYFDCLDINPASELMSRFLGCV